MATTAPTQTPSFITINSTKYFGRYNKTSKTIQDAKQVTTGFSTEMGANWIKAAALGELASVTLGGADSVTITELTQVEALTMQNLLAQFELAKEMAMPLLYTQAFDKLLGK